MIFFYFFVSGEWPPYASYLTFEIAKYIQQNTSLIPNGIIGNLYVRAVYNDVNKIMDGCGGVLWCPYESFRLRLLKISISWQEYQIECNTT